MKPVIDRAAARAGVVRLNSVERGRERCVLRVQRLQRAAGTYRGPGRRVSLGSRTKSDLERDQRIPQRG